MVSAPQSLLLRRDPAQPAVRAEYQSAMDAGGPVRQHRGMLRRIGLAALWFFAAWSAGAMAALMFDLGAWVAPVAATTAAAAIFWALGRQRLPDGTPDRPAPGAQGLEA